MGKQDLESEDVEISRMLIVSSYHTYFIFGRVSRRTAFVSLLRCRAAHRVLTFVRTGHRSGHPRAGRVGPLECLGVHNGVVKNP
eukprot:1893426-Pyramimonas_sp.AAC.1